MNYEHRNIDLWLYIGPLRGPKKLGELIFALQDPADIRSFFLRMRTRTFSLYVFNVGLWSSVVLDYLLWFSTLRHLI